MVIAPKMNDRLAVSCVSLIFIFVYLNFSFLIRCEDEFRIILSRMKLTSEINGLISLVEVVMKS